MGRSVPRTGRGDVLAIELARACSADFGFRSAPSFAGLCPVWVVAGVPHQIGHAALAGAPHQPGLVVEFGGARRRVRVAKMRGIKFREGFHDFTLETGGIDVYPRLVAAEHHAEFARAPVSTGSEGLDAMLGGGLVPGTNALLIGPSGVGKTTTVVCCLLAALKRGERCIYYLFDETLGTLMMR